MILIPLIKKFMPIQAKVSEKLFGAKNPYKSPIFIIYSLVVGIGTLVVFYLIIKPYL
jgi:hypothetical protein